MTYIRQADKHFAVEGERQRARAVSRGVTGSAQVASNQPQGNFSQIPQKMYTPFSPAGGKSSSPSWDKAGSRFHFRPAQVDRRESQYQVHRL